MILSYAVRPSAPTLYLLMVSVTYGINQLKRTLSTVIRFLNRDSTSCLIVLSCSCQILTAFSIIPFDFDALTGDSMGTVSPTRSADTAFFSARMLGSWSLLKAIFWPW